MSKMEMVVTTNALTKRYGKINRVNRLNLVVPEGVVYGFLGPNGAGKSTTLKMLLGLVHPTAGEIMLFGQSVHGKNRLQMLQQVGALIESPSYYGHLTGEENLRVLQKLRAVPERNVREVLRIVRLEAQRDKRVSQYSLGMKQRLGLAGALLAFPRLLILDEPTNGLDPAGIQEMRELICSLPEKYDMTVLLSSHLLSEIDQMAEVVGIIRDGTLIFQDKLSQLHAMGQKQLALRTDDNTRAALLLSQWNIPVQYSGQWLLLPDLEDSAMAACGQHLAQQQIHLLRIEERQKSLEDIFLELTGEEGDAE